MYPPVLWNIGLIGIVPNQASHPRVPHHDSKQDILYADATAHIPLQSIIQLRRLLS